MVAFPAVGWDNHRVPVPAGAIDVPTNAALQAQLDRVIKGGVDAGDSVDLHLSGTLYNEIGWYSYEVADGGTGLRLYGNEDGSTEVRFTGGGMPEAHSACLRVGSQDNLGDENNTFGIYNIEFNGNSNGNGSGAIWGVVIGASFDDDPQKSNCHNYVVQGNRIHTSQISLLKLDGNGGNTIGAGGSSNGLALGNTIHNSNQRARANGTSAGSGEGIYIGDGNESRAFDSIEVNQNHVFDIYQGEAIEFKRNGVNSAARFNLIHDNVVHTGGALKNIATGTELEGNRIYDVTIDNLSAAGTANAFFFLRNTVAWNNVCWNTEVAVGMPDTDIANQTVEMFNNTLFADNIIFRINQDGSSFGSNDIDLTSDCDLVNAPTLATGDTGNLTFNGIQTGTAPFVGPITGTANAGNGAGSGFQIDDETGLSCAITNSLANTDICGTSRTASPVAGAFSASAEVIAFEITAPADGAVNVSTGVLISGTADSTADVYQYQIANAAGDVWNGSAFVAPVGDSSEWLSASASNGTWIADQAQALPEDGSVITVEARRC